MRYLQILGALLILGVIGIIQFSRLKPDEAGEIELTARLEAFYLMQTEYRREHQVFFNPRAEPYRSQLSWLEECDCEVRWSHEGFSVVARADFDGDGISGVWYIGHESPEIEKLAAD